MNTQAPQGQDDWHHHGPIPRRAASGRSGLPVLAAPARQLGTGRSRGPPPLTQALAAVNELLNSGASGPRGHRADRHRPGTRRPAPATRSTTAPAARRTRGGAPARSPPPRPVSGLGPGCRRCASSVTRSRGRASLSKSALVTTRTGSAAAAIGIAGFPVCSRPRSAITVPDQAGASAASFGHRPPNGNARSADSMPGTTGTTSEHRWANGSGPVGDNPSRAAAASCAIDGDGASRCSRSCVHSRNGVSPPAVSASTTARSPGHTTPSTVDSLVTRVIIVRTHSDDHVRGTLATAAVSDPLAAATPPASSVGTSTVSNHPSARVGSMIACLAATTVWGSAS